MRGYLGGISLYSQLSSFQTFEEWLYYARYVLDKWCYMIIHLAGPETVVLSSVVDGKFQHRERKFAAPTRCTAFFCSPCGSPPLIWGYRRGQARGVLQCVQYVQRFQYVVQVRKKESTIRCINQADTWFSAFHGAGFALQFHSWNELISALRNLVSCLPFSVPNSIIGDDCLHTTIVLSIVLHLTLKINGVSLSHFETVADINQSRTQHSCLHLNTSHNILDSHMHSFESALIWDFMSMI